MRSAWCCAPGLHQWRRWERSISFPPADAPGPSVGFSASAFIREKLRRALQQCSMTVATHFTGCSTAVSWEARRQRVPARISHALFFPFHSFFRLNVVWNNFVSRSGVRKNVHRRRQAEAKNKQKKLFIEHAADAASAGGRCDWLILRLGTSSEWKCCAMKNTFLLPQCWLVGVYLWNNRIVRPT